MTLAHHGPKVVNAKKILENQGIALQFTDNYGSALDKNGHT